jgi:hypothetical protein
VCKNVELKGEVLGGDGSVGGIHECDIDVARNAAPSEGSRKRRGLIGTKTDSEAESTHGAHEGEGKAEEAKKQSEGSSTCNLRSSEQCMSRRSEHSTGQIQA